MTDKASDCHLERREIFRNELAPSGPKYFTTQRSQCRNQTLFSANEMSILDPAKFREFEHAGWENIPASYHEAFGGLTVQAIEPLLNAAGVKRRVSFLDIATGPGYVAAAAAKRGATVLGVDFSPGMVVQARQLHPGIDFRDGDAEQLPLGNGLFDAAAMNFGILHLGRPEKALIEAHRVLRAAGASRFPCGRRRQKPLDSALCCGRSNCTANRASSCPKGRRFFVTAMPRNASAG